MTQPTIKIHGYRILVALESINTTLELPEATKKIKNRGTVVSLGDGRYNAKGDRAPFDVKVGDRVLMSEFAVTPYVEGGTEYRIIAAEDVLGVL